MYTSRSELELIIRSSTSEELDKFFNKATKLFSTELYNSASEEFMLNITTLFYSMKSNKISMKISACHSNLTSLTKLVCHIFEILNTDAALNIFVQANPIDFLKTFNHLDNISKKRGLFDAYVDCLGPNIFMLGLESISTCSTDIQVCLANFLYDNTDTENNIPALNCILDIYNRCSKFIFETDDILLYKLLALAFDSSRMDLLSDIKKELLHTADIIGVRIYDKQYSKYIETAKLLNLKMDINFWRDYLLDHYVSSDLDVDISTLELC